MVSGLKKGQYFHTCMKRRQYFQIFNVEHSYGVYAYNIREPGYHEDKSI